MKRSFPTSKLTSFFVLLFVWTVVQVFAQTNNQPFSINTSPLPAPTSPVMDYAGVLDENTKQQLAQKIIQFRDSTNPKVELAVAVVQTTGDRDVFDYSLAVARGWGIGSKEDDNPSALLFIAVNDRKYFTQVSRDLEDELPDGVVGSLQRQYLVPAFKQQQYGKGISDTIDAYINTIRARQSGEPTPEIKNQPTDERSRSGGTSGTMICLIIVFVLLVLIFSRGGRGGGRGGYGGGGFGSALQWIIGSVLANSGRSGGSSGGWGGSSGGGGSSWGGFGGGGDFGGGGSGGSW